MLSGGTEFNTYIFLASECVACFPTNYYYITCIYKTARTHVTRISVDTEGERMRCEKSDSASVFPMTGSARGYSVIESANVGAIIQSANATCEIVSANVGAIAKSANEAYVGNSVNETYKRE